MQKYFDTVLDRNGNVVVGATVTVTTYPAGTSATVYSSNAIGSNANPLTTDANGYFEFWAPNGRYSLTISKTGITTRTVTNILIQDSVVSVTEYGAKGDGVTDDLAAIQSAVDAAYNAGGGTVTFPPGTFLVLCSTTGIQYKDNVSLIGSGRGVTTIKLAAGSTLTGSRAIIEQAYNAALPARGYNSKNNTIAHLSVDGNISNNAGKVYEGISGYQVKDLFVYDVEAFACGECGLQGQVTNKNTDQKSLITFLSCIAHDNTADGIQVGGADVISCWSHTNGGNGISHAGNFVSGGVNDIEAHIVNCRAEYNTSSGIIATVQVGPNLRTIISDCTAIHNSGYGIACNMNYTKVSNCTAEYNTLSGIFIDHDYCVITGGCSNNNTAHGIAINAALNYTKVSNVQATLNGSFGMAMLVSPGSGSHNTVTGCSFSNNTGGAIYQGTLASDWQILNNEGYNPTGAFGGAVSPANPAVPTSTTAKTNTYSYPCLVTISGGTVTNITVNGVASGLTSGAFVVGVGGTISVTYTVAPTWQWHGL